MMDGMVIPCSRSWCQPVEAFVVIVTAPRSDIISIRAVETSTSDMLDMSIKLTDVRKEPYKHHAVVML